MTKAPARALALAVVALAMLSLGVVSASAHGRGAAGTGGTAATKALVADAADRLGVTTARHTTAITDAATAQIDEAVEDGDVDADEAADLKERASSSLRYAMAVSRTRVVAANVGKTAVQLNAAFRAARKAQIAARIDQALEDGDIDEDEAADLRADLETAKLAGYKATGLGGLAGLAAGRAGSGCGGAGASLAATRR